MLPGQGLPGSQDRVHFAEDECEARLEKGFEAMCTLARSGARQGCKAGCPVNFVSSRPLNLAGLVCPALFPTEFLYFHLESATHSASE
jgi:hypothetical protein